MTELIDFNPPQSSFRREVLEGLSRHRKAIPPKYFYDERGSELFERICGVDEYYVTRTELAILAANLREVTSLIGEQASLIEFGSGASVKTRLLLEHAGLAAYLPIDISRDFLAQTAEALSGDFPDLPIYPICADFTQPMELPERLRRVGSRSVGFFPGSTIGNLDPVEAGRFLRDTARLLGAGGALLIGVDRVKDPRVLEAAYNDRAGITAAFNLNLLRRMNQEIGSDFPIEHFEHDAFFNPTESRIEMHLVSLRDQIVNVAGKPIGFREGETIHTESSYKYTPERFLELAREAGFVPRKFWTDPRGWFGVYFLEVGPEAAFSVPPSAYASARSGSRRT